MYARSLISNAGWSKKTQRPSGRPVTGGGMAAQVAVGYQGTVQAAMRAASGTPGDAEVKQFARTGGEESGEFHGRRIAHPATTPLWHCHKPPVSTRRSHRRSTVPKGTEKPLFEAVLNNGNRAVEHLVLD
jgi:hypothetical protein